MLDDSHYFKTCIYGDDLALTMMSSAIRGINNIQTISIDVHTSDIFDSKKEVHNVLECIVTPILKDILSIPDTKDISMFTDIALRDEDIDEDDIRSMVIVHLLRNEYINYVADKNDRIWTPLICRCECLEDHGYDLFGYKVSVSEYGGHGNFFNIFIKEMFDDNYRYSYTRIVFEEINSSYDGLYRYGHYCCLNFLFNVLKYCDSKIIKTLRVYKLGNIESDDFLNED